MEMIASSFLWSQKGVEVENKSCNMQREMKNHFSRTS